MQPDWVDTNKIAIPQADEQQRLLVNLITLMERDKMPLPRFWYLPRGKKAVVVMSGDDHSPSQAPGGTAANFDGFKSMSPAGCVVANWECVRSTSYVYPNSTSRNAQAAAYIAEGFEVALHPQRRRRARQRRSRRPSSRAVYDTQLPRSQAKYTEPAVARLEPHALRLLAGLGLGGEGRARERHPARRQLLPLPRRAGSARKPGFMTGGGFPMRFADTDGTLIDVYQANTNMHRRDEPGYPATVNALLDNARRRRTATTARSARTCTPTTPRRIPAPRRSSPPPRRAACPSISYKQMLDWIDGRNNSTIRGLSWNAGTLTFVTTVGAGANGLQTLLPTQGPSGTLSALSCGGSPRAYTLQTIKGIQYAMFDTITGTCVATYS